MSRLAVPAGVCAQCRVSESARLYKAQVPGPVPWLVWCQRSVQCRQPPAHLHLQRGIHRRPVHYLHTDTYQ
jgi:hypothetical protein